MTDDDRMVFCVVCGRWSDVWYLASDDDVWHLAPAGSERPPVTPCSLECCKAFDVSLCMDHEGAWSRWDRTL